MVTVTESSFEELKEMQEFVERLRRDVPKATAMTLTWMGQAAKNKVTSKLPGIFDRPNPWTVGSTYLKPATASLLEARVFIKDNSFNSLAHHIEGGKRPAKGFEKQLRTSGVLKGSWQYVVPAKRMKLDQYGNVSRGVINKVLSALGSQWDQYANSLKLAEKIFVVTREGSGGLPAGIFEVVGSGSNRNLVPMFIFVKSTTYRRRYPFFEITEDAAYDEMESAINRAIDRITS